MLLTIGIILVAMIASGALEIWLFWRLGERDDRRRSQGRNARQSSPGRRASRCTRFLRGVSGWLQRRELPRIAQWTWQND
jgi:hypothetical protein